LQKRFFGHFLKDEDMGWEDQPPVFLNLRQVDGTFLRRAEQEWPLARTSWTKFYLDPARSTFTDAPPEDVATDYEALGDGLDFFTAPLESEMEITGPLAAKLFVSSSTADADIFIAFRVLRPDGSDVTFVSAQDPKGVPTSGWLRASHRKLDPQKTLPYRPWHTHDEKQPLTPGEVVELDVEIWPTSVIVPVGYRFGISLRGKDFLYEGEGPWAQIYGIDMRGNGIFYHNDSTDRPEEI